MDRETASLSHVNAERIDWTIRIPAKSNITTRLLKNSAKAGWGLSVKTCQGDLLPSQRDSLLPIPIASMVRFT